MKRGPMKKGLFTLASTLAALGMCVMALTTVFDRAPSAQAPPAGGCRGGFEGPWSAAAPPPAAFGGRGPLPPVVFREKTTITAIPGVIAAGTQWKQTWQVEGNNADGLVALPDGSVLLAQDESNAIVKLDNNGNASPYLMNTAGGGSLAIDHQGRLWAVQRMWIAPIPTSPKNAGISILAPPSQAKLISNRSADGMLWTGRPNDLAADSQGGAYFTQQCVYYAGMDGMIHLAADNVRGNGIVLSPDDKVLYTTNGLAGTAWDVQDIGKLGNRRDLATFSGPGFLDGLAVDSAGRIYVSTNSGVEVVSPNGTRLGVIPTPRVVLSVGFAGPDRKMLYVVTAGARDANGQEIRVGNEQTARTIYRIPMQAQGVRNRGK